MMIIICFRAYIESVSFSRSWISSVSWVGSFPGFWPMSVSWSGSECWSDV